MSSSPIRREALSADEPGDRPRHSFEMRVVGERWETLKLIARGGMGAVYEARHQITGQSAAVKVLDGQENAAEVLARFQREARLAASIGHRGITHIYDAGVDPATRRFFIAMELLEGRTLRECMKEPNVSPLKLLALVRKTLEPLAAAHERGIVHRDLKPDNVFVIDGPRGDEVKLLDFGIARSANCPNVTQTGSAVGTPTYMSPEQSMDSSRVGPPSDVWAVGVLLYEILAGRPPFLADGAHAVVVAACTEAHAPLVDFVPDMDPLLSTLVDRCLDKNPDQRPRDAGTLLIDLGRVLGLSSLPPPRRSVPERRTTVAPPQDARTSGIRLSFQAGLRRALVGRGLRVAGVISFLIGVGVTLLSPSAWPVLALGCLAAAGAFAAAHVSERRGAPRSSRRGARKSARKRLSKVDGLKAPLPSRPPPAKGPADAPVAMVLFGDFTDPNTRRARTVVDQLMEKYPSDLRVIWRHSPSRPAGYRASEAAVEALHQAGEGAFWRLADLMLRAPRRLNDERIEFLFKQLGLNQTALRHALKAERHWLKVDDDRELAATIGVKATPAYLIEGRAFERDTPFAVLCDVIDAARATDRQSPEAGTLVDASAVHGEFDQILVQWTAIQGARLRVIRSRAEARERADRLVARARLEGTDFLGLIATFGDGDHYVGVVDELPREIQHAAAALIPGQVSGVLESARGFHILRRR